MAKSIKVKRSGIDRIFRKTPLRSWMDEQPRKALTYPGHPEEGNGWTTEMMCRESWYRGLDVRIGSLLKWTSGSKPRPFIEHELRKVFKTIKF